MKQFGSSFVAVMLVLALIWFIIYNFFWVQFKQQIIRETVASLSDKTFLTELAYNAMTSK